MQETWRAIGSQDKKQWIAQNKHMVGADLKKAMESWIQRRVVKAQSAEWGADNEYLDEEDVERLYADKPQQKQSIYDRARQVTHPVRNCTLYVVPKLTSKERESLLLEDESGTHVAAQEKDKERAAVPSSSANVKPSKMQKLHGEVTQKLDALGTSLELAATEQLQSWVPSAMVEAAKVTQEKAKLALREAEMAQEEGFTGDPDEVVKKGNKVCIDLDHYKKNIERVIAMSDIDENKEEKSGEEENKQKPKRTRQRIKKAN